MWRNILYGCVVVGLVACGSKPVAPVSTPDMILMNPAATDTYRVRSGDGLYAIAWRFGLDYQDLARWNNLAINDVIHPRQTLVLNATLTPTIKPKPKSTSNPTKTQWKPVKSTAKKVTKPAKTIVVAKPVTTGPLRWNWPLKAGKKARRKGSVDYIKFFGKPGDSIRAAASGQVVYVGSGLRGYGKLIIIKHNKNYLSAYGHNRRLLVREGQRVNSGDKIATMGHSERNTAMLHFEIRRNGKPVNPLRYLPKS